jgi:hypothetical protein
MLLLGRDAGISQQSVYHWRKENNLMRKSAKVVPRARLQFNVVKWRGEISRWLGRVHVKAAAGDTDR